MIRPMQPLAPDLWIQKFPLSVLGTDHGRTVTVMRLTSGKLILHSMAPFSAADVAAIKNLGEPSWLLEAMLLHDTYAAEGPKHFPGLPLLGPPGFDKVVGFPVTPLLPAPAEWEGQVQLMRLKGAPKLEEHVVLHVPSKTLIVADLVFNFPADERGWNRFFHRYIAGFRRYPGTSRIFKLFVADKTAFRASLEEVLEWNFDRIIPGHGEVIERGGKEALRQAMADAGFL